MRTKNKIQRLWIVLPMLGLILSSACVSSLNARAELNETTFFYHRDLRWQRFSQASKRMEPDLREAYLDYATQLEGRIDIENINIVDVDLNEKNDEAVLRVRYRYVLQPSLSVQSLLVKERWKHGDKGWQLVSGAWPMIPVKAAAQRQDPS